MRDGWLINADEAIQLFGYLHSQLTGTVVTERATEAEIKAFAPKLFSAQASLSEEWRQPTASEMFGQSVNGQDRMVAVMPLSGAITRENQPCGPRGTVTLSGWLKDLDRDPRIAGSVLLVASPGGQVSGTQLLASTIKSLSKPVVALVHDGMAASAAYWIASSCNRILSSHGTNRVGSIGVYMQVPDVLAYWKKEGLEVHEVFSSLSTEKNGDYREVLKGNYEQVRKNYLDPVAQTFIDSVKANRPNINTEKGDPFKGAMFFSKEAIEIGLIDGMGTLEDAISLVYQLSGESPKGKQVAVAQSHAHSNPNPNTTVRILKSQTALLGAFALVVAEGSEFVEFEPSAEQIQALEALLQQRATEAQNLANSLQSAQNSLSAVNDQVASLTTERDTFRQQAEEYGRLSGRLPGSTTAQEDPKGEAPEAFPLCEADVMVAAQRKALGLE